MTNEKTSQCNIPEDLQFHAEAPFLPGAINNDGLTKSLIFLPAKLDEDQLLCPAPFGTHEFRRKDMIQKHVHENGKCFMVYFESYFCVKCLQQVIAEVTRVDMEFIKQQQALAVAATQTNQRPM